MPFNQLGLPAPVVRGVRAAGSTRPPPIQDEGDRMVDMGFAPDLRRILRLLRSDRQTLMFSATMPSELNRVAREALMEPLRVDLAEPSEPPPAIAQAFFPVTQHLKADLLSH